MNVRNSKDLGAVIRQARMDKNLSQEDLARAIGVHQPKVSEIERGKSGVRIALILQALQALNLTISIAAATQSAKQKKQGVEKSDDEIDLDAIANTGLVRK